MDKEKIITPRVKDMEFVEELPLLEIAEIIDEVNVLKVMLKDYREKTESDYSILTLEIEFDDIIHEWKYDYGKADKPLKTIIDMILGSSGLKTEHYGSDIGPILKIVAPPSLLRILVVYVGMKKMGLSPIMD